MEVLETPEVETTEAEAPLEGVTVERLRGIRALNRFVGRGLVKRSAGLEVGLMVVFRVTVDGKSTIGWMN